MTFPLFSKLDIWRFTTYWTLIFICSIYTMAGLWACLVFGRRHYKWAILLPLLFFFTGAFIGFLSGSLVGECLALSQRQQPPHTPFSFLYLAPRNNLRSQHTQHIQPRAKQRIFVQPWAKGTWSHFCQELDIGATTIGRPKKIRDNADSPKQMLGMDELHTEEFTGERCALFAWTFISSGVLGSPDGAQANPSFHSWSAIELTTLFSSTLGVWMLPRLGLAIAAIYNAGFYRMSTWVPFLWGLIQALVVIMGSYSTVTTIL